MGSWQKNKDICYYVLWMCFQTTDVSGPDAWAEGLTMKAFPINLQIKDILMKYLALSGFPSHFSFYSQL